VFFLGALTAAAARPLAAQTYEVGAGYVYLRDTRSDIDFPRGWSVSAARNWLPLSAVVQADGEYQTLAFLAGGDSRLSLHGLMAGGRLSGRIGKLREFVEVLGGAVRGRGAAFGVTSDETRGALQAGLGVGIPLGHRIAARVQFDGRAFRSQDWKVTQVRIVAGATVGFR
jgi:hypothetical protein